MRCNTLDDEYFGQSRVCSLTPTEFEFYCKEILQGYAEEENLCNFKIEHNVKLTSSDGIYQIDVYATCTVMGSNIKIICECKQYKNRVNREKVVILADKVRTLGANKGVLLSTAGFQSGAIQYAEAHGIALIQVFDTRENWFSHSAGPNVEIDEDDPFLYPERHLPVFQAQIIKPDTEFQRNIYPTRAMLEKVYKEMDIRFQKLFGRTMAKTSNEDSGERL